MCASCSVPLGHAAAAAVALEASWNIQDQRQVILTPYRYEQ